LLASYGKSALVKCCLKRFFGINIARQFPKDIFFNFVFRRYFFLKNVTTFDEKTQKNSKIILMSSYAEMNFWGPKKKKKSLNMVKKVFPPTNRSIWV
jgi:hypothetical protein